MNPKEEIIKSFEKTVEEELKKLDKIESKEEQIEKFDVIFNMYKILQNYDELRPTLIKFFREKRNKDTLER